MKIKSFGSGSSGNLYLVQNEDTKIIIDCGIRKNDILKNFTKERISLSSINGVLITHCHHDHTESINMILDYEIPIYCSLKTANELDLEEDEIKPLYDNINTKIGSILIKPLCVNHGSCECLAFILKDKEKTILFATDFYTIPYNLSNFEIDEIWIECNYVDEIMEKLRVEKPNDFNLKYKRQIEVHSSLQGTITHLEKLNLSKCKKIYLIHISSGLGDKELMRNTIQEKFDIWTYSVDSQGKIE